VSQRHLAAGCPSAWGELTRNAHRSFSDVYRWRHWSGKVYRAKLASYVLVTAASLIDIIPSQTRRIEKFYNSLFHPYSYRN